MASAGWVHQSRKYTADGRTDERLSKWIKNPMATARARQQNIYYKSMVYRYDSDYEYCGHSQNARLVIIDNRR